MPNLFCIVYHGNKVGIRMVEQSIQRTYPNAWIVSAYYRQHGKIEIHAAPELIEAYTMKMTGSTNVSAGDAMHSQNNVETSPMQAVAKPSDVDLEEQYWQLVAWIRTQYRFRRSQVVAYIEGNTSMLGSAKLNPKAIDHVNRLNPGVVIFFTATKQCREQIWGWIEHHRYPQHPKLNCAEFKDCLASNLSKQILDELPILTVYPRPLFAVVDKDKHVASVASVQIPTLLERFCCFKRKDENPINLNKVIPLEFGVRQDSSIPAALTLNRASQLHV